MNNIDDDFAVLKTRYIGYTYDVNNIHAFLFTSSMNISPTRHIIT